MSATNLERAKSYTDADGNEYRLLPHEVKAGDIACAGCDLKTWTGAGGGTACQSAPTCTPEGIKGRHVWKMTKHWSE